MADTGGSPAMTLALAFAVALVLGALGGLAASLAQNAGGLEVPRRRSQPPADGDRRRTSFLDLGFWAEVILGAVAALVLVAYLGPSSPRGVVWQALLAGFGGSAVLGTLKTRLLLGLERARTVQQERALAQMGAAVGAALEATSAARTVAGAPVDGSGDDTVHDHLVRAAAAYESVRRGA